MGRGKTVLKRIENKTSRQVTFSKRRSGLLKKTQELSVLCDAQIGLIVFSSRGKLYEYSSHPLSMGDIIEKYLSTTGAHIPENNDNRQIQEQLFNDLLKMKKETHNLQLSLQHYRGDFTYTPYQDLDQLEHQLQSSIIKVRARKDHLLQQQLDNLQKPVNILEQENQEMFQFLMTKQLQKQQQAEHHQAMTELKLVGNQQEALMDQFTFLGNHLHQQGVQPTPINTGLLFQPLQLNPFIQHTQPNLQDPCSSSLDLYTFGAESQFSSVSE